MGLGLGIGLRDSGGGFGIRIGHLNWALELRMGYWNF